MSFTIVEQATPRLHRSELAVPGIRPKFFEKAAASAADAVMLDLEDSVAPDDKEQARENVVEALNYVDWGERVVNAMRGIHPALERRFAELLDEARRGLGD